MCEKMAFEYLWSLPATYYVIQSWGQILVNGYDDVENDYREPIYCKNEDELREELKKAFERNPLDLHRVSVQEICRDGTFTERILVEQILPREIQSKLWEEKRK